MAARTLGLVMAVGALLAGGAAAAKVATPAQSSLKQRYTAEESAALGAAVDRRARAQEQRWDRRLNQISASICNGC